MAAYVDVLTLSSHREADGRRFFDGAKYLKDKRHLALTLDTLSVFYRMRQ